MIRKVISAIKEIREGSKTGELLFLNHKEGLSEKPRYEQGPAW